MIRLLENCREIARQYFQTVPAGEELREFASAILLTFGALGFGLGAAAILGGSRG